MTCTPGWLEINKAARIKSDDNKFIMEESNEDRPDLVRITKVKLEEIIDDIDKRQIFGKVAAYVYTTEFQKHGPPNTYAFANDHGSS